MSPGVKQQSGHIDVLISGQVRNLQGMCVKFLVLQVFLSFACFLACGQDTEAEFMAAVLYLAGCGTVEELSEDELGRYADLASSPVRVNSAPRSRLLSCGLFSAYQAAVLEDYRQRSGDILSFSELASLDGFGHDFVNAIRIFVSLDSRSIVGRSSAAKTSCRHIVTMKSGIRNTSGDFLPDGTYSFRYRFSSSGGPEAGISLRSSYQTPHFPPERYSLFLSWRCRSFPLHITVGDYVLRFGQGLALWSGFSIGGVSTPDAFVRRPSGANSYNSYSGEGAFRGLAADITAGAFGFSVFAAGLGLRQFMEGEDNPRDDILYGFNAGWYGISGQCSFTCFAVSHLFPDDDMPDGGAEGYFSSAVCSADLRYSLRGTELFAELSYDVKGQTPAVLAGFRAKVSGPVRMAAMLRYYPPEYESSYSGAVHGGSGCSNEHGISVAMSHSSGGWVGIKGATGFGSTEKRFRGSVSADAVYAPEPRFGTDTSSVQIKLLATETVRICPALSAGLRFSGRYRSYGYPFRADLRTDLKCSFQGWSLNARFNVLHCREWSYLAYAEGGYNPERFSLWLRAGLFFVDTWDDRIYVYERDAPGNFNIPAYYGRGYWLAFTSGFRFRKTAGFYIRSSFQDWPWRGSMAGEKPPKIEVRLQLVLDF